MSVLTTNAIYDELIKVLPASLRALSPLLGGQAAAFSLADQAQSDLADNLLIGNAEGIWLDLLARGMNIHRAPGEADGGTVGSDTGGLRGRMRTVNDALTRPAILAAANDVLSAYGVADAIMVEWYEGPYFDSFYFDDPHMPLSSGPNTFAIIVPQVNGPSYGSFYFGSSFYDASYYGASGMSPAYGAVYAAVEKIRAAGVRWFLLVDHT